MEEQVQTRQPTKLELKRAQIYEDRRKRLINKGVNPARVDDVIAREDYESLPIDTKVARLEKLLINALQGFRNDVLAIKHNQDAIADALDVNIRAIGIALTKAGVDVETQNIIIKEVAAELEAAHKVAAPEAPKTEADEKAYLEKELSKPGIVGQEEPQTNSPGIPEGATVFGG